MDRRIHRRLKENDMIELKPCKSSNLAATGYDPVAHVLAVKFNGSDVVHHYRDVPAETIAAMDEAPSIGSFFAKHVREKFHHEVVDGSALPAEG
jgi:hypothetical protein